MNPTRSRERSRNGAEARSGATSRSSSTVTAAERAGHRVRVTAVAADATEAEQR